MAVSRPAVGGHRKRPSTSTDHLHTEEVACPSCHNHYVFSEEGCSCFVWLSCATCSFRCKCWWMSSVSLRFVSQFSFFILHEYFLALLVHKTCTSIAFSAGEDVLNRHTKEATPTSSNHAGQNDHQNNS